jgi:anti-sigma factor RsiW
MSEHEEIRKLLPLAVAGALDAKEQRQLDEHLRGCEACAAEAERWTELAGALRRLPTPQPSPALVERVRARAQAELAAHAEERWDYQVLAFLVLFSWTLVLASWPIVRLLTKGMLGWFNLQQTWLGLVGYTVIVWVTAGVAAGLLGLRQRAARRAT